MNELNVLKFGYIKGFRHIKFNVGQFCRNIKYAYQRVVKGYCDLDMWNFNDYCAQLMSTSLRELADTSHGCPGGPDFDDKLAKEEGYIDSFDKWVNILYEMADHFENTLEDTSAECWVKERSLFQKYLKTDAEADRLAWSRQLKRCNEWRAKEKDKACKMLNMYYFDLWD